MRLRYNCFITVLLSFAWGSSLPAAERLTSLSVDDPRPVAEAMLTLESLYGWAITYEDPRYVHANDVADVTYRVRRDLGDFPMGRAPRVLVPRGGPLTVSYTVSSETGMPASAADLIQKVLDARAAGESTSFRLLQPGGDFHVVPKQSSILDAVITLPSRERDGVEVLEAICAAVAESAQTHVLIGAIPQSLFRRTRATQAAFNSIARDVLTETLAATGRKLSWQLLYDPGLEEYFLNIHPVSPGN